MEQTEVVTMIRRPNIKPLQQNHIFNNYSKDHIEHEFNVHDAKSFTLIQNIDEAESLARTKSKIDRNKNKQLMEQTEVNTMTHRPNIKSSQQNHISYNISKDRCEHEFNVHDANSITLIQNIDKAESPVRPNSNIYRNKNKTLRLLTKQTADKETPTKMKPKAQTETESEQSKTVFNVKSEKDENMKHVQRNCAGRKDIVILHTDEDAVAANQFRELLRGLIPDLTVEIFGNIHLGKPIMESLRLVNQEYSTVLVYETHNFHDNSIVWHQVDTLYSYSLEYQQQIISVWVENSKPPFTPNKRIKFGENISIFSEQIEKLVKAGRMQ